MTGDFSSDVGYEDLAAVFEPYLVAAQGTAAEQGDDEVVRLLQARTSFHVSFSASPVTTVEGHERVAVDVVLGVPAPAHAPLEVRERVAAAIDAAAGGDGYHVRSVTLTAPR